MAVVTATGIDGECGCCGACCEDCPCCAEMQACGTLTVDLYDFSEAYGGCSTVYTDILGEPLEVYEHVAPYPGGVDPADYIGALYLDCLWIAGPFTFDTIHDGTGCTTSSVTFYLYIYCFGSNFYCQPVQTAGLNMGLVGVPTASSDCDPLELIFEIFGNQFTAMEFRVKVVCA